MLAATRRFLLPAVARKGGGPFVPHRILGIAPDADVQTARARYLRLAKQYHPDVAARGGAFEKERAAERFSEVAEAYEAFVAQQRQQEQRAAGRKGFYAYHAEEPSASPDTSASANAAAAEAASAPRETAQRWGAGGAVAAALLDPSGLCLMHVVGAGVAGYAAGYLYVTYDTISRRLRGFGAVIGALDAALRGMGYDALRGLLLKWHHQFKVWARKGGPYADFAREMAATILAALKQARRTRASTSAASAAAAAASASATASPGASAAAGSSHAHTPNDAHSATTAAASGPSATSDATDTVEAMDSAAGSPGEFDAYDPPVVTVDRESLGGLGGGAGNTEDPDVILFVPLDVPGSDAGGAARSWWTALAGGVSPGEAHEASGHYIPVSLPASLPTATLAALATQVEAMTQRWATLSLEDAVVVAESVASAAAGVATTRIMLEGVRFLVRRACAWLLKRARGHHE